MCRIQKSVERSLEATTERFAHLHPIQAIATNKSFALTAESLLLVVAKF